jgi:hypothetical protein
MGIVAVGVPGWPLPSTSWDLWPFAGIALTLLFSRNPLRIRIRPGVVAVALAVGPCFALAVHTWGVVTTFAAAACIGGLVAAIVRTARRSAPPV